MIIKIIPETDEERNRLQECFSTNEIVHTGIREYFVFGNKNGPDGNLNDFHEWTGSPRYLMGNLRYFFEVVNDERRMKDSEGHAVQRPINQQNRNVTRNPEELENEVGKLNHPVIMENRTPKIIKRGEVGNIQAIDVSNLKKNTQSNGPKIIQMADLRNINEQHINPINVEPFPNVPKVDMAQFDDDDAMKDE